MIDKVDFSKPASVLYVEDNPANLELMKEVIEEIEGINFYSAQTAEEGLDIAEEILPDLILMDINLPKMNGIQALAALKKNDKTCHIPVIALSANAMPKDINRGLKAGFVSYLTKPIDLEETIRNIQKFIGK